MRCLLVVAFCPLSPAFVPVAVPPVPLSPFTPRPVLISLQDKREKAVLELSTVDPDFVVLVIFGLKFVNRSYWRDRSALGEGIKKLLKLQKSSSAATVVLDYYVEVKRLAIDNTHG